MIATAATTSGTEDDAAAASAPGRAPGCGGRSRSSPPPPRRADDAALDVALDLGELVAIDREIVGVARLALRGRAGSAAPAAAPRRASSAPSSARASPMLMASAPLFEDLREPPLLVGAERRRRGHAGLAAHIAAEPHSADQQHQRRPAPQQPGVELERRLQQHEIAVARDDVVDRPAGRCRRR